MGVLAFPKSSLDFGILETFRKVSHSRISPMTIIATSSTTPSSPTLSSEQANALARIVHGRESLWICGEAGTGKSFLVQALQKETADDAGVHITATTGVSAFHLRGVTVHSCLGIGISGTRMGTFDLVRKVRGNRAAWDRICCMRLLLIDEISMMSALLFERIDALLRAIRRNDAPFGGVQMIVMGDFFQLLPVFHPDDPDQRLAFESPIWTTLFPPQRVVRLRHNFRQRQDPDFAALLQSIRNGDGSVLTKHPHICTPDANQLFLVPTRRRAKTWNDHCLSQLPAESKKTFDTTFDGVPALLEELRKQLHDMDLISLELRVGCRVMLVVNLDIANGLVNGALGTVRQIHHEPNLVTVRFDHLSSDVPISTHRWTLQEGKKEASADQIPLIVAYALTIHKSQSLTVDAATLDLGQCFAPHQAYVAVSRLRNKKGLSLTSFRANAVFCDDRVVRFTSTACKDSP